MDNNHQEEMLISNIDSVVIDDNLKIVHGPNHLNTNDSQEEYKPKNSRWCMYIIYMTNVTLFVQLGMVITSLNPATPALERFFNECYVVRFNETASDTTIRVLLTTTLSMIMIGAVLGTLATAFFAEKMSRKKAIIIYHCINIFSLILMGIVTFIFHSYEAIIIGRLINGFARGFGMNMVNILVSELSCEQQLPRAQSSPGWLMSFGFIMGNVIGHEKVLGGDTKWPILVSLPVLFSLYYLGNVYWLRRTPAQLIRDGEPEHVLRRLKQLRASSQFSLHHEYSLITETVENNLSRSRVTLSELITNPVYRTLVIKGSMLALNTQSNGFVIIMLYSDELFKQAGIDPQYATLCSILLCTEAVILAFIGSLKLRRKHQRKLLLSGNLLIIVGSICMCVAMLTQHLSKVIPYLSILCMTIFMLGAGIGPLLVSFPYIVEIIHDYSNAGAMIMLLAGATFWLTSSVIGFAAPYLLKYCGAYSWLIYSSFTAINTIYFSRNLS